MPAETIDPMLKLPRVMELCALAKSTVYAYMAAGAFPRPRKVGARAVAWRQSDVAIWLASRAAA